MWWYTGPSPKGTHCLEKYKAFPSDFELAITTFTTFESVNSLLSVISLAKVPISSEDFSNEDYKSFIDLGLIVGISPCRFIIIFIFLNKLIFCKAW